MAYMALAHGGVLSRLTSPLLSLVTGHVPFFGLRVLTCFLARARHWTCVDGCLAWDRVVARGPRRLVLV